MTKNSPIGVTVAYANKRWAIMFHDSLDLDQWLPAAQALMTDLRTSARILPDPPPPPPEPEPPMPKKKVKKPKKY